MSASMDLPRHHRWLGKENDSPYIPSWYEPHGNLDLEVTHLGVGQGFPIRKVMPHRRWAVDENGSTLDQRVFEEKYITYLEGYQTLPAHNPRNEAIPNVLRYVRMKYDRLGSIVDMDYNDNGEITKTEKYTQEGEVAPEFLARTQEKSDKLAKMELLAEMAREGFLTPEDFQAKVSALMGKSMALDESATAEPPMIAAPPRRAGRPKGSKNKPKEPDFAAQ